MSTTEARPNLFSITFYNECIYVTVAKKAKQVSEWISSIFNIHIDFSKNLLIGLDTEWLPNISPSEDHPVAILQLCIGNRCLIFQILHVDFIPPSLNTFLSDPRHTFCGVGIEDDVDRLYRHHGLRVGRILELNDLARLAVIDDGQDVNIEEYKYMSLKKMASVVLRKEMEKPLDVTLSKWDAEELNRNQVEYAAIDAVVSYQIAFALCLRVLRSNMRVCLMLGRPQ
ncbi:PREDICTED: Werner Syndrome-like exonuclease [Erythranthe guttata]|uniref:Werner Syndrome-like exonuclease n=1 Tax=Erythranthe guttata TaxID=4155 RepID=UPI00064DA329|nr:PREDICTED: Werner Syndrome-like exonuclease [Erythranthe guttata]|eukprot:XP_012851108.1 PREDICTED: Werner Syndrome-like exonuclease [Erythranthe guttata]